MPDDVTIKVRNSSTGAFGDVDSSNPLPTSSAYTTLSVVDSGEWVPGTASSNGPTTAARKLAYLKARAGNSGKVAIGKAGETVSLPDGTADTASGYELSAGEALGPLPIANLNVLKGVGTGATDSVTYLLLG